MTYEECEMLRRYIITHRPKHGKHYDSELRRSDYFWEKGKIEPRLAWLNDQIKWYWIIFLHTKYHKFINKNSKNYNN